MFKAVVDNQTSNVNLKLNGMNTPSKIINIGENLLRKVFGVF